MTATQQWRVIGKPAADLPAYDFIWHEELEALAGRTPEQAARDMVASVDARGGWLEGPTLLSRTVTTSEWRRE